MMKKILAVLLSVGMLTSYAAAPVAAESEGGTYVMINKLKDDYLMKNYAGFESYLADHGATAVEDSPTAYGVSQQVQLLDELIAQGVAGVAINSSGEIGYDEVVNKAKEAGIAINSFDSALGAELRSVNVNQATSDDVGAYFARLGVMAALRLEYAGGDDDMVSTLESGLAEYEGEEITLGCLTASIDAPVQNEWIAAMEAELSKEMYAGKVSTAMDIKYGNDDMTESTTQAQAYLAEDKVDVVVCISSVATIAAAQVFQDAGSDIKVTGCGAPSQIQGFMPKADEETFSAAVPYIALWDLGHVGAVTACALMAETAGTFDGSIGSTLAMDAWGTYEATEFTVTEAADGGSEIVVGSPMVFDKTNVADWVDTL